MHTNSALHTCEYFNNTTIIFVYLGLQYKWNQLRQTTFAIPVVYIRGGLHAGKWPDLMTSKPDALNTLGYDWTDCTGTTLADAIAQWSSSGNQVLICKIGTHWKTTGATSTLGCHWNHTGWCYHPVISQWQSSVNLHNWNTLDHHWKTTGRPLESTLETHWLPTIPSPVAFQCTLGSTFQAHWITTELPLAQGKGGPLPDT